MKGESLGYDNILNIVIETGTLISDDRYNNNSIKDLKKDFPDTIDKSEEALKIYVTGNNDFEILKTDFPEKWTFLNKK